MTNKIHVLIDHGEGEIRNGSLEALAWGQKIAGESGGEVHAVVLNDDGSIAAAAGGCAVESVISVEHERLAEYDPDAYSAALAQVVREDKPDLLLMSHIYQNIDLAPKLAASMGLAFVSDCIGHRVEDGEVVFTRQMFRNKINADILPRSPKPWIASLQAGAASSDDLEEGKAEVRKRPVDLSGVPARRKALEVVGAGEGKVDLSKADMIVGVGRGIKKEENLEIVRELADALGAEIGASRPVVDNEWLERERQIGSSGQTVTPKLYVACGISGAIQHIVGMKGSNCIVAINNDPNAPIFNIASYGVVGDLFEVVPALTKKLRGE